MSRDDWIFYLLQFCRTRAHVPHRPTARRLQIAIGPLDLAILCSVCRPKTEVKGETWLMHVVWQFEKKNWVTLDQLNLFRVFKDTILHPSTANNLVAVFQLTSAAHGFKNNLFLGSRCKISLDSTGLLNDRTGLPSEFFKLNAVVSLRFTLQPKFLCMIDWLIVVPIGSSQAVPRVFTIKPASVGL